MHKRRIEVQMHTNVNKHWIAVLWIVDCPWRILPIRGKTWQVGMLGHQKSMERKLEVGQNGQLFLNGWPHNPATRLLWQKSHQSVSLWWDPNDVPHCWLVLWQSCMMACLNCTLQTTDQSWLIIYINKRPKAFGEGCTEWSLHAPPLI